MADISLCVSPPSFVLAVFLLAGVSVCQPITRSIHVFKPVSVQAMWWVLLHCMYHMTQHKCIWDYPTGFIGIYSATSCTLHSECIFSQVSPAVTPQSMRGGALSQLLPRQPVPHLGQLLSEQSLLGPGSNQRVECHAGRAVTSCRFARPLLWCVNIDIFIKVFFVKYMTQSTKSVVTTVSAGLPNEN